MSYFGDRSLTKYRQELFAQLGVETRPPKASPQLAEADAALIRSAFPTVTPEHSYSYLSDDRKDAPSDEYDDEDHDRLRRMMPALTKRGNMDDLHMLALRSLARKRKRDHRHPAVQTQQDQLENEIESWVIKGAAPPVYMRFEDSHFFEEDAARALLTVESWPGWKEWRELGFFPDRPEKTVLIDDVLSNLEKIPNPIIY